MEIHVQLATKSKMFTSAANGFGGEPNSQADPVVIGLPGVLPVMNRVAVEYSIKVGLALGCKIAPFTKWDRKSYYYPDLPKNYQISQYDLPLCYDGEFEIAAEDGTARRIRIRRAHLEEDAGKLLHEAPGGYAIDHSIVDLNRAGTPLLEIVTEPDFSTPNEVAAFGQELQKLVQFLGVSEAQMQMGHMRFEPNINVHITDAEGNVHKTAITEIKNLNSFSVLERATAYEIRRQIREWEETGSLGRKSTYGWDESTQSTFHQRDKEEAHDYRYFPDPDLVPVEVSDEWLAELKQQVGELPAARRKRYVEALRLSPADAGALLANRQTGDLFEELLRGGAPAKRAANVMTNTLAQIANEQGSDVPSLGLRVQDIQGVLKMLEAQEIAPSSAPALFREILKSGGEPRALAEGLGMVQSNDSGAVDAAIDAVIAENSKAVEDYRRKAGRDEHAGRQGDEECQGPQPQDRTGTAPREAVRLNLPKRYRVDVADPGWMSTVVGGR